MDKFLSPNFEIASSYCQKYTKYFQESEDWKKEVDDEIKKGKLCVIQTFFNSIDECKKGEFKVQVLTSDDLQKMYHHLIKKAEQIAEGHYLYIFCCQNGISEGQALIADIII